MIVDETETLAAKAPGTVIYVIGESASRNYMKAFTPDFQCNDDTPWLSGHVEDPNFGCCSIMFTPVDADRSDAPARPDGTESVQ